MSETGGRRFFTVPNWLLWIGLAAGMLTLVLTGAGAWLALHVESQPNADPRCVNQRSNRTSAIDDINVELWKEHDRLVALSKALDEGRPGARFSIEEERAEVEQLKSARAGLQGPPIIPAVYHQLGLLLLTILVFLSAAAMVGATARVAGIPPVEKTREVAVPFAWVTAANFAIAAPVVWKESIDPNKTGFDWASLCVAEVPFWISHACLLPLCSVAAVTAAVGWYVTQERHVPTPDPSRRGWGVKRYVQFLETWSFATVVLVGFVTAIWVKSLSPSRTDRTSFFLGFGSLGVAVALVVRLVRRAMLVRSRCEHIIENASKRANLPPDPTDNLLGTHWWKLPTVFAASTALAWEMVKESGLTTVLGLH